MAGVEEPVWLDQHLDEWVDAGLIECSQREAIADHERHLAPERYGELPVGRRLTIGAEVAVYLGSVLALTGGAVAVGNAWDELSFAARLALAAAIAVVGLVGGRWAFRHGEPGTDRVAGFVTALGTGGVGFTVALVGDRIDPQEREWIVVAVGFAVMVVSSVAWANRERPTQLVGAVVGFVVAGSALLELAGEAVWLGGAVAITIGSVLASSAHLRWVRPRFVAIVAGGVLSYLGGFMLGDLNQHLGPAAALAVALGYVLYAVRVDQPFVLVLAVLAATAASSVLLSTTFDSALSALLIALIGLALVIVVTVRSGHRPHGPVPG